MYNFAISNFSGTSSFLIGIRAQNTECAKHSNEPLPIKPSLLPVILNTEIMGGKPDIFPETFDNASHIMQQVPALALSLLSF